MSVKKFNGLKFREFMEALAENKYIQLATTIFAILSTIGVTLGYIFIFWISLGMFVVGLFFAVFKEYGKFKIYSRDFVPVPVVINISNPANSKNALNLVLSLIENDDSGIYRHRKENLERIFHIKEDDLVFEFKGNIENKENLNLIFCLVVQTIIKNLSIFIDYMFSETYI